MRKFHLFFGLLIVLFISMLQSCVKDENLFVEPKAETEYFDYLTKRIVTLNLDYGLVGRTALVEIYTKAETTDAKLIKRTIISNAVIKEDKDTLNAVVNLNSEPISKIFTDENCTVKNAIIEVPAGVDKLYACSDDLGMPKCIEISIVNNVATYRYTAETKSRAITRGMTRIDMGTVARTINASQKLYSLYDSFNPGRGKYYWEASNEKVKELYSTVNKDTQISTKSTLGELVERVDRALTKKDNSQYAVNENYINISISAKTPDNIDVTAAQLDLVFLGNHGDMHSTMLYYYYKSNTTPTLEEIKALPKFVTIPRMTSGMPNAFVKTRLQFFGENGKEKGTDLFPPGYTIGFAIIADLFPEKNKDDLYWTKLPSIESRIKWALSNNQIVYSNQSANYNQSPGCISLYDEKSEKIILGFEDQAFRQENDKSYEDVLFYVDATPIGAIIDKDKPKVPVIDPNNDILVTETTKGTLAFEDIWPTGGDYDMNDVIVEYESAVTFNKLNKITKIVDTFKSVHDGAQYIDAFGYVINDKNIGTVNISKSNYYTQEESNQFILYPNNKEAFAGGKTYTVTREFSGLKKADYVRNWNPFIVVKYQKGLKNRVEVHLPKHKSTSWADASLIGTKDDAYFINKAGTYPFAIELPIINFEPVTESKKIGTENEYPYFLKWAESSGKQYTDWYKNKK